MQRALEDAANRDAAEVIGIVEIGDQDLKRAFGIAGGRGNGIHDALEQRLQVGAGLGEISVVAVPVLATV